MIRTGGSVDGQSTDVSDRANGLGKTARIIDLAPLVRWHARQNAGQYTAQAVVGFGVVAVMLTLGGRAALAFLAAFVVLSLLMFRGYRWAGLILFIAALALIALAVSWLGYDAFRARPPPRNSFEVTIADQTRWAFFALAVIGGTAAWFLLRGLHATVMRSRLLGPPPADAATRVRAWLWAARRFLGHWQAWAFLALALAAVLAITYPHALFWIDLALLDRPRLSDRVAAYRLIDALDRLGVTALPVWLLLIAITVVALALVFLAVSSFGRFRRHLQQASIEAQRRDPRPPIVLLRSFADDAQTLFPVQGYGLSRTLNTLEHRLEIELRVYGPVVAIGRPGETLPPLGAAREYLAGESWRERVRDLIGQAQLVVVVLGASEGLVFEYELIAALAARQKLLLVIPPEEAGTLQPGWDRFLEQALGGEDLVPPDLATTIIAIFPEGREPVYVWHARRGASAEQYKLALQLALRHRPQFGASDQT
jgi:hypothetical protein